MRYFLTFFLILTTISLHAQKRALKNRFTAGIIIGANTSQIKGDLYSGYDKFGVFAGFRAIAKINTKSEIVLEMQYNRKGSKNPNQFVPARIQQRFISLDYIEVPILYHRKIETPTTTISLEGGISYARLFGLRINENANTINYQSFSDIQDEFNKDELALILGSGILFNEHIRLFGRFAYSFTSLYENENPVSVFIDDIPEIKKLKNIQLAVGMNYIF